MLKELLEIYELLEDPNIDGYTVAEFFKSRGAEDVSVKRIEGIHGFTDVIKIRIKGKNGKSNGGSAPTLGIIGILGGIATVPRFRGLVSDADGAITALAVALKLIKMEKIGEVLEGDVIITTHICPGAPMIPHDPVPFVGSPVEIPKLVKELVDEEMDAILSIDTTRGNRIINVKGFAITPTVKEGWILRVSEDLLTIMEQVTGKIPAVVPITMQDITPYGNGVYHLNAIMQPSTVTNAPVVGVAITSEVPVPGSATGVNDIISMEQAARFCLEVAKYFGEGRIEFYNKSDFERLVELYGSMKKLQQLK